ncbi:MAG: outer membrane protein transport protein [Acidobacteria bacterium]|nr:outer membrane protein transport protein [Acidobacteriota bacterium]MCB9398841.1 outer membrane protein transport protein [Acidobacteriota bacterium]
MQKTLWLVIVCLSGPVLWAQHNNRAARDLQFQFGNPGARSLAFGGAFIGMADDATAPVVNPAGMVQTRKRSASLELAYVRSENTIPFTGGEVVQTNLFEFDFNFDQGSFPENRFQVPYAAVLIPAGDWRWAVFVHQQADLRRQYTTDRVNFDLLTTSSLTIAYDASQDDLALDLWNAGLSVARQWGEHVSAGISLWWSDMDYHANSTILLQDAVGSIHPVYQTAEGQDQDWGGVLGLLWLVNDQFSVGATYKRQGEFGYTAAQRASVVNPDSPDFQAEGLFKVPDALSIGCSVKASDTFSVNLDINRVYYSQITDNLLDFQRVPGVFQEMPDVTEIHVGAEQAFLGGANPVFVRIGYWRDPYHAAVNNIEDSQILDGTSRDPRVRDFFFLHSFEKDVNHYAFGLGLSFSQVFQMDCAYEWSELDQKLSVSGIYRF